MSKTVLKIASAAGTAGRIGMQAVATLRTTAKGYTRYINPGLPKAIDGAVHAPAQMLGVENRAPNQAVHDMFSDALDIGTRAGVYVGTQAAAHLAVACLGISASLVKLPALATQKKISLDGWGRNLDAAATVIEKNSGAWAESAAAGAANIVGEMTDSYNPGHFNPMAGQIQDSIQQNLFDLDDANEHKLQDQFAAEVAARHQNGG